MKKISAFVLAAALTVLAAAPAAYAHDMSSMDGMPGMSAANGMGAQMHMDEHMRMTDLQDPTPLDVERANDILATLRRVLLPYRNYHVALAQGFRIFMPTVPQDVYHFTNYAWAGDEYRGRFDLAHPGSILYVKQPGGNYVLVGAMYSAPPDFTPQQLDQLVPLGIARWHEHVNICLPESITLGDLMQGDAGQGRQNLPGMIPIAANPEALERDQKYGVFADGRFGFTGKIHDAAACKSAGGNFLPLAFGWMVHVYPFAGDDLKVAFGTSIPKPAAQ
ncbi:MAG: hypothetical protein ACREQR_06515 [Candidatus Binataceae bacterium]